ncbi:acyl carrier protein [bacterium]|nr:acyl carrier protein [bacterium]
MVTNKPLMSVGLDSLAAAEFANTVSNELGVALSAIALFDHPTLDSIASHLANERGSDES